MIITIKGADFSAKNIGTLSTWTIFTTLGSGATYSGNRVVEKDSSLSATITIADGYELGSAGVSVIMGTTNVTSSVATVSGNTITISIATVTDNVTINVPTLITAEEIPNYTFTINPTPSNATVTLTASGYTQSGNSINVPNGTTVSWSVSADDYTTRTGNWTINGGNKTENITLIASGGGEIPDEIDISSLFTSEWRQGAMIVDSSKTNYPGHQANQTAYRCSNTWADISDYESIINVGAKLQITITRAVNINHQIYGLILSSEAVKDATKVLGTLALQYDPIDFGVYSVETREIEIPSGTKYIKTTWLPEANEIELGTIFSAKIIPIEMGV